MAALGIFPAVSADRLGELLGAAAAAALLLLAAALFLRRPGLLPWALAFAGAEYAGSLFVGAPTTGAAPVYAAGLLFVAELGYWALEPLSARDETLPLLFRGMTIVLIALAASAVGLLLALVSDVEVAGGLGMEALGLVAAVLAVAAVAHLARSRLG